MLDGGGRTISRMTISGPGQGGHPGGLIPYLPGGSTVKDLCLDQITMTGDYSGCEAAGILVGQVNENVSFEGVSVTNSSISVTVGSTPFGGLVGAVLGVNGAEASVTGCTMESTELTVEVDGPNTPVGIFVGKCDGPVTVDSFSAGPADSSWPPVGQQVEPGGDSAVTRTPAATAARAQVAVILMRFCKKCVSR